MSFGLGPLRPKSEGPAELGLKPGDYGVHDSFAFGNYSVRGKLESQHPLMLSEQAYEENQRRLEMTLLRNTQGLHAPLKLAAELRAFKEVGRLPFLPSSNVGRDTLTGRDLSIDFTDILNTAEFDERLVLPHACVERSMGIL